MNKRVVDHMMHRSDNTLLDLCITLVPSFSAVTVRCTAIIIFSDAESIKTLLIKLNTSLFQV